MYAIEVDNLSYVYPNGMPALHNISLQISKGEKVVLLGSSGSGKTTFICHFNGSMVPRHGMISILGKKLTKKTGHLIRWEVGLIEQDFRHSIFIHSVWEYVTSNLIKKKLPKIEIIRRAELALGLVGMLTERNKNLDHLSPAQKKKVSIARVLAIEPQIIILDEPISGLDPKGRSEILSILQAVHFMGKTIVIATHDVDFAAEWGDRLFIFSEGKLLATGTADLTIDENLMNEAQLRIPLLSQPFLRLSNLEFKRIPKTINETLRIIWQLARQDEQ